MDKHCADATNRSLASFQGEFAVHLGDLRAAQHPQVEMGHRWSPDITCSQASFSFLALFGEGYFTVWYFTRLYFYFYFLMILLAGCHNTSPVSPSYHCYPPYFSFHLSLLRIFSNCKSCDDRNLTSPFYCGAGTTGNLPQKVSNYRDGNRRCIRTWHS